MLSRLVVLLHLAILCVSLNCLFPQSSLATGVPCRIVAKKSTAKVNQHDLPVWEVTAWGACKQDAEEQAAEKVSQRTAEYLRSQNPHLVWSPSPLYVRKHLHWSDPQMKPEENQEVQVGDQKVMAVCWAWAVTVTPTSYEEMVREDGRVRAEQARQAREVRAQERLLLLGQLLGVVVVGLLAVVVYLRVDEWTKGYYSRSLAAVGAGLVAVVVLVLWFRPWNW